MENLKFLQESSFLRFYGTRDEFHINNVGYDDFSYVSPILHPRIQYFYTLHYVLSGKGFLKLNGIEYEIHSGQLFFLPPDMPILYYPDKKDPWKYIWFAFNGTQSEEYRRIMGFTNNSPVKTVAAASDIFLCIKRLFSRLKDETDGYFLSLSAFYEILHLCSDEKTTASAENAKKMIDENFSSTNFHIDWLCRSLAVSHSHLCREFQKSYGTTTVKYLIQRRIEFAQHLLKTTGQPVKTIAFSCGFRDEIHFMKSFKRIVGCSPTQYRKSHI